MMKIEGQPDITVLDPFQPNHHQWVSCSSLCVTLDDSLLDSTLPAFALALGLSGGIPINAFAPAKALHETIGSYYEWRH